MLWIPQPINKFQFLIWQRIRRILFLASLLILDSSFWLLISLLIKRGFPPWYIWVTNLRWRWISFILFITFNKRLPLLILFTLSLRKIFYIIFIMYVWILAFRNFNVMNMILISRLVDSRWILLLHKINFFWLYLIMYNVVWRLWAYLNFNYTNSRRLNSINFLILLSIPPFIFFLFKVLVWLQINFVWNIILTVRSWIVLSNYIFLWLLNFYQIAFSTSRNTVYSWRAIMFGLPLLLV